MSLKLTRWLHRRGFSRKKLHGTFLHQKLGDSLLSKNLWNFQRESVAKGWFIGIFFTTLPIPAQSLLAIPLAFLFQANIAVTYALLWLSTPLTAPIHLPACYFIGCWILRISPSGAYHHLITISEQTFNWEMLSRFISLAFSNPILCAKKIAHKAYLSMDILLPLYLGAVVLGLLLGLGGYLLIHFGWKEKQPIPTPHRSRSGGRQHHR